MCADADPYPTRTARSHRGHRPRLLAQAGAFALATMAALSACQGDPAGVPRATTVPSRVPTPAPTGTPVCPDDTCWGGSPTRVVGPPVPWVWTLPKDWVQHYRAGSKDEDAGAEAADGSVGFVLIEHVGAADAKDYRRPPSDPPGRGAKALATWLASRPYLRTTRPQATTVGGRPAWQLDARIGPLPPHATLMGRDHIPGVFLLRLLPPQHDTDSLSAWFDRTYTSPSHLWLIDLPNGMVGYVEAGSDGGQAGKAQITRILQQMRFQQPAL
jgi:hypothetical protein